MQIGHVGNVFFGYYSNWSFRPRFHPAIIPVLPYSFSIPYSDFHWDRFYFSIHLCFGLPSDGWFSIGFSFQHSFPSTRQISKRDLLINVTRLVYRSTALTSPYRKSILNYFCCVMLFFFSPYVNPQDSFFFVDCYFFFISFWLSAVSHTCTRKLVYRFDLYNNAVLDLSE